MKRRVTTELHQSLESRLRMYAIAASAAGIGMGALSQPAAAKVIYKGTNQNLPVKLDLNHDGIPDFLLQIGFGTYGSFAVTVKALRQNQVAGYAPGLSYWALWASALPPGAKVGPVQRFGAYYWMVEGGCGYFAKGGSSSCGGNGPWDNVSNRYLGLEFFVKGKVHYGWARLNVTVAKTVTAVLTGYAYETTPNKSLVAGKTKGPDVVERSSATLGHLARGAAKHATYK